MEERVTETFFDSPERKHFIHMLYQENLQTIITKSIVTVNRKIGEIVERNVIIFILYNYSTII